jgi:aldose 1-epimerase
LDGARLVTRLDTTLPRIADSFPFNHELELEASARDATLVITTTVRPTGGAPVPVSFGFHPYFRLPSSPRHTWQLRLPAREHVELDAQQLPTGNVTAEPDETAPIGHRSLDNHYALGDDRRFELANDKRSVTVSFDDGFPYGQVYAPPRTQFACIEPMTATVNALGTSSAPLVAPGSTFRAAWQVSCTSM